MQDDTDHETDNCAVHGVALPPVVPLAEAGPGAAFLVQGAAGALWYEPGETGVLFITFDNLATVEEPWPRLPWMHRRVRGPGHAILGAQSYAKDWYRPRDVPDMLAELAARGFFAGFRRVVLTGASMGGFAALNFAPLIPGAIVLAFSPQSSMDKRIVTFDQRFNYSIARSDWREAPFLDAAAAVPYVARAHVLSDPFVPEDRAHCARLRGRNLALHDLDHGTHQAVRLVVKCDAMDTLLAEIAATGEIGAGFWRKMRARREIRAWRRMLIETLEAGGRHPRLLLRACDYMQVGNDYLFARNARKRLLEADPGLAAWSAARGAPLMRG